MLDQTSPSKFEWPFYRTSSNYKGTLSNMYAGCEPVCNMVAKLVKNGYFYSHPWNDALGYMFRKNVPAIVFVFGNECDNAFTFTYADKTRTIKNVVGAFGITKTKNTKKLVFYSFDNNDNTEAIDPFCIETLRDASKFKTYYKEVVVNETNVPSDLNAATKSVKFKTDSKRTYSKPSQLKVSTSGMDESDLTTNIDNSLVVKYNEGKSDNASVSAGVDVDGYAKPFSGMEPSQLLTASQLAQLEDNKKLPGIKFSDGKPVIDYEWLKTFGFYQLRNAVVNTKVNMDLYMMVTDANAPRKLCPLHEYDGSATNAAVNAALSSVMLYNDSGLVDELERSKTKVGGKSPTTLMNASARYWSRKKKILDKNGNVVPTDGNCKTTTTTENAIAVRNVLGLDNPYTKYNLVIGRRSGWASLAKKWQNVKTSRKYILLGLPAGLKGYKSTGWRKDAGSKMASASLKTALRNQMRVKAYFDTDSIPSDWARQIYVYAHDQTKT